MYWIDRPWSVQTIAELQIAFEEDYRTVKGFRGIGSHLIADSINYDFDNYISFVNFLVKLGFLCSLSFLSFIDFIDLLNFIDFLNFPSFIDLLNFLNSEGRQNFQLFQSQHIKTSSSKVSKYFQESYKQ